MQVNIRPCTGHWIGYEKQHDFDYDLGEVVLCGEVARNDGERKSEEMLKWIDEFMAAHPDVFGIDDISQPVEHDGGGFASFEVAWAFVKPYA